MTSAAARCPQCSGPVYLHQRFCERCGAPLATAGPVPGPAQPGAGRQNQGSFAGCCIAAVVGFFLVFCSGLVLAALAASLLGPGFAFAP
jgi:hypothetical protein